MKLTRTPKILAGAATAIFTLSPLLYFGLFFFPFFFMISAGGQEPDPSFIFPFLLFFPLMFLNFFLRIGLMIFYIAHIVKNKQASELLLIILAVGIYFMPYLAMPAYYLIYVWPQEPPEWANAAPQN